MAKINFGKLAEAGMKFLQDLGKQNKANSFGNFQGSGNFKNIQNRIADIKKKLNGGEELGGYKPNKLYQHQAQPVGNDDEPVIVNATTHEYEEPPLIAQIEGPNLKEGLENPLVVENYTDYSPEAQRFFDMDLNSLYEASGGSKYLKSVEEKTDPNTGMKYKELKMKNGDVIKYDQAFSTGMSVDYADPNKQDLHYMYSNSYRPAPSDDHQIFPPIIKGKQPNLSEGLENPFIGLASSTNNYEQHVNNYMKAVDKLIKQSGGHENVVSINPKKDSQGNEYDEIKMKNGDVIKMEWVNRSELAVDYADPKKEDILYKFDFSDKPGAEEFPIFDDYQTPPIIKGKPKPGNSYHGQNIHQGYQKSPWRGYKA